mgnify:FL=1
MGGMSRRKGAAFEREIANLIKDHLGLDAKRNLMQTAEGGHDLLGVSGWAIECKRYASIKPADLRKFWEQTVMQAHYVNALPCLITKADRQPIQVHIQWMGPGSDCYGDSIQGVATISFELWCGIVRETLQEDEQC